MLTVSLENAYKILLSQQNLSYSYWDYQNGKEKDNLFFIIIFTFSNNHKEMVVLATTMKK